MSICSTLAVMVALVPGACKQSGPAPAAIYFGGVIRPGIDGAASAEV